MERLIEWIKNYKFSVQDPPIISLEGLFSMLLLLLLSLVAVFFHLIRIFFNSPVDFSMDWNLFLSWIPLIVAFIANNLTKRFKNSAILLFLLSMVWIVFLPNAPYMITDLAHLTVDYHRDLTWHDVIMLFFYAEVSLFNGLVSVYWIHQSWNRSFSKRLTRILLLSSFPLAGFGVYLGRVRRMNSWDIVHNPKAIVNNLIDSLMDRTALLLSLEIGILLAILYLVLWVIIRFRIRYKERIVK
ncbi:hypothetical protein DYBT9275_01635 [Dyadobacter sp. CECT 9275]|uniref:DUF1361 domain-containing protein n=1 Tax=Dyadobacter helix TaxID=2822344 RepID=A0A916NKN5_9BACT|nr:DUF1361 domain-containing protein [Dyadobacter sp. CECT 9275]CAG4995428.1 hypothetical protein DYBT9275_01635 [Dyadobacter sp. CECT 9275]